MLKPSRYNTYTPPPSFATRLGARLRGASRYLLAFLVAPLLAVSCMACNAAEPNASQEAVLVRKPMFFGHGGIDPVTIKTGLEYVAPSTDVLYVSMAPQKFPLEIDDLMTADTVPLDFHGELRLQVTDPVALIKAGAVGADGGEVNLQQWFVNNLQQRWVSALRDAVKKHPHGEVLTTSVDQIDDEVTREIEALIAKEKLPVRLLSMTAGRANPPQAVADQRIQTATQQQRVQTENERKRAEDARAQAELARAQADNAYRQEMTLTADQFVQMEMAKLSAGVMREVCAKGSCSFTFVPDNTPLFSVLGAGKQ